MKNQEIKIDTTRGQVLQNGKVIAYIENDVDGYFVDAEGHQKFFATHESIISHFELNPSKPEVHSGDSYSYNL
jgi:hypothetical protein